MWRFRDMQMNKEMNNGMWLRFGVMLVLSFIAMYLLMYLMVDRWSEVYPNLNQFYMTLAMVASMAVIELAVMSGMYNNSAVRFTVIVVALVALALSINFTRNQTGIGNTGFLKSMIPHHSGAILMCREADISDAEIQGLCQNIIKSQQQEIDQMNSILQRNP